MKLLLTAFVLAAAAESLSVPPDLVQGGWLYTRVDQDAPARAIVFAEVPPGAARGRVTVVQRSAAEDGGELALGMWGWRSVEGDEGEVRLEIVGEGSTLDTTLSLVPADTGYVSRDPESGEDLGRLTPTPCDLRFERSNEAAIEGCGWIAVAGEMLKKAWLLEACRPGGECYLLVPEALLP